MSIGKRGYLSWLQALLVFLIVNGTVKTKLATLPFLCCGEIVKNSIYASLFIFHLHCNNDAQQNWNLIWICWKRVWAPIHLQLQFVEGNLHRGVPLPLEYIVTLGNGGDWFPNVTMYFNGNAAAAACWFFIDILVSLKLRQNIFRY